jgi:hypothetical protein
VYSSDLRSRRNVGEMSPTRSAPSLTGLGAVLLVAILALLGGTFDVLTGVGLRLGFAVGLSLGTAIAALLVRRRDLLIVVFAPPLVYLASSLLFVLGSPGGAGSMNTLIDASAGWLVYGFPTIAAATGMAVVIAGIRVTRG